MIFLVVATIQNEGVNNRRNYLFAFCLLTSNVTSVITGIYFVYTGKYMFSVVPNMLNSATNITCAAFCLFFLHPGGGPEYKQMDGIDNDEVNILDIEQVSDNDSDSQSESEDDEEEDNNDPKK